MQETDLETGRSIAFRMTAEDRLAACKLDYTEHRRNWRDGSFWGIVFCGLFILARPDFFWIAPAPVLYLLGGIVFWRTVLPRRIRRESQRTSMSAETITLTFAAEGLRLRTPHEDVSIPFGHCYFWRTNAAITLVYIGADRYVRIPERLADEGFAMEELKERLWQALGAPGYKRILRQRDKPPNILKAFE